jgi:hypothetical protein
MERLGIVDELREQDQDTYRAMARRMSPAALARIFPHRHVAPAPITAPVKLVRANAAPKKEKQIRLSSGLRAEIAAYAFRAVDRILQVRHREMLLESSSIKMKDRPTLREVVEIVALQAELRPEEFLSRSRERNVAWPRQVAMALVKETIPAMSYAEIGRAFSGKDHTTVMHACKRTQHYILEDDAMAQLYRRSRETIEARWPEAFK